MVGTTFLGGAAIFGIIGAFWGKIRSIMHRLLSLIIVSITISGYQMEKSISLYCWKNLKRSPFGDRTYGSQNEFVKCLSRFQTIGFEIIGRDAVVFWKGWRPLLLGFHSSGNNSSTQDFKITFIRGMWNIDDLLVESLDLFNEKMEHSDKKKRFFIQRIFGMGFKNQSTPSSGEINKEEAEHHISIGDKRLLKWTLDDLGIESTNGSALSNLFFPDEIEEIVVEIKQWKKSEQWYKERNIPWKRGWLLHGIPGTGKTALIRAIAEDLDLPIWLYDLSSMSNEELVAAWRRMLNCVPCVALIEDLDTVFDKRKNISGSSVMRDKLTFDCFLNCLDGVERSDGVFTILTTNIISKLDASLGIPKENGSDISTRPGRIDRVVELKQMDDKCRLKFAQKILIEFPNEIEVLVLSGKGDTGAQFQDRCARRALNLYWEKLQ